MTKPILEIAKELLEPRCKEPDDCVFDGADWTCVFCGREAGKPKEIPIRTLCEALKEAHEALSFYGSLSKPSGKHACDVDVRFQIEGPTIANEWLKKWGGSEV